jgi:hypothetical protein
VLTICSSAILKSKANNTMSDNDDESPLAGIAGRSIARKKSKSTAQKFTRKTKAFKHLEKLFKDNSIDPTDRPSDVRARDPLFQDFTANQFRSQFNKLKKEVGLVTKEGESLSLPVIMTMSILEPYVLTQ